MKTILTATLIAIASFACQKTINEPAQNIRLQNKSSVVVQFVGKQDISSWFWDSCTNERVNFSGVLKYVDIEQFNSRLGFFSTVHVVLTNPLAMGETSGSSYQVININNFTAFDNQNFNLYRYTHYDFLKIVAPRNGSSFTVTEQATLVINGQGTTVVNVGFGEYTSNCR